MKFYLNPELLAYLARSEEINNGGTLRILLLEDLRSDAEVIGLQLRKLNMPRELRVVSNRLSFEQALDEFDPHLVLSDYSLPQYTGLEALNHVRERDVYLPFIICTGSLNEEIAVSCIKAGADDYVLKDSLGRLCSAIENALNAKANLIAKESAIAELQASEENIRAIAQNAPDNIFKIDALGTIIYANRGVQGGSAANLLGHPIYTLVSAEHHVKLKRAISKCFKRKVNTTVELRSTDNIGDERWYLCRIGPVMSGDSVDSVVFITSDITRRIRAEREMSKLNEQLQTLAKHLEKVREEEKEKIAIEIHDQLGQELTGTKLALYWIKQQLQSAEDLGPIIEKVDYLVELSTTTIETVRRIAHELRPVVLDNMGLVAALEWHVVNFNKTSTTRCRLHVDVGQLDFGKDLSTAIYRVVQEALTNIQKHAEASRAWIDLIKEDDTFMVQIRDDGKGIEVSEALRSNSLGLFGIRERVRPWKGRFELDRGREAGVILRVTFDIEQLKQDGALYEHCHANPNHQNHNL